MSSPVPFGTCERGTDVIESTDLLPLTNDLGGTSKPFELIHDGTDAVVSGVLTRYREPVLRQLMETPRFLGAGFRGDGPGDLGTCVNLEGRAPVLLLEFIYGGGGPLGAPGPFAKPVMVSGGLPSGLRFYSANWRGPTRSPTGTAGRRIGFVFWCVRKFFPATQNMAYADENVSALAGQDFEATP